MLTTMANGFVVSVTQDLVEVLCPCPARSRVQQLCTVRYKATQPRILLYFTHRVAALCKIWSNSYDTYSCTFNSLKISNWASQQPKRYPDLIFLWTCIRSQGNTSFLTVSCVIIGRHMGCQRYCMSVTGNKERESSCNIYRRNGKLCLWKRWTILFS